MSTLYGRHTATAAGATAEPGALPLPAWGTFLGLALGFLAATSGPVYAVLWGSDGRWGHLALALAWAVAGGIGTVAAVRLRRGEPLDELILYLGGLAADAAGVVLFVHADFKHAHGVAALLLVLGAGTVVGTALEFRGGGAPGSEPADPLS